MLPGPLLSTVIAGSVALTAEPTACATALLSDLAAGATATLILPDDSDFVATRTDGGWQVNGTSGLALGIASAQKIVLPARVEGGGVAWLVVDNADSELEIEPHRSTDLTVDVGALRLRDHVVPDALVLNGIDSERARCLAVALVACAASGVIRWCVDAVAAHLRTREQFGRLIGTFQALQHKAAMLLVNSELANAAAWDAVRGAEEPLDQHQLATAAATVMAVAPAPDLALEALTMFGAIGFTWEHDMHLYWRRATSLAASVGPVTRWTRRMGEMSRSHTRDMSLNLGDAEGDFRARVAAVLDEAIALDNDGPRLQGDYEHFATGAQRSLIADAGLIAPHWPQPWGLDATPLQQLIIDDEFDKRPGVIRPSVGIAEWILPTVLRAATPDLHERFVIPTLSGELVWCQLFSEPGAGSDLASLITRATKVDGGWRIKGHKIWTSGAHRADYGALLARTDTDAAKHRGIGYFIVDMRADGVEVHPIRTAAGEAHFNEVFLNDVFIGDDMLLGDATGGWDLAIATMAQERVAISGYVKIDRAGALRDLAADAGPDQEAAVRVLGEVNAYTNAIKALSVRETIRLLDGQSAGPASSIAKVATSVMLRRTLAATLELTGRQAMIEDSEPAVAQQYLHLPAELIGGGTMEIQLNIIAQMILGLPRR
jgi:alkylation response protein AidB-like acyl-CoA dehydrogenase